VNLKVQHTIMLVGQDTSLRYLITRFAERSGYQLTVSSKNLFIEEIMAANPAVIIFLSTELLETTQASLKQLASLETPIIVCASVTDETRVKELGADYCLTHPLTYDDFQTTLMRASTPKHV
jgi:DNA-binding response OmpR family regulator